MFILKFIDDEDDLSVKEFTSFTEMKDFLCQNKIDKTWHQIEEVKKVIPNIIED